MTLLVLRCSPTRPSRSAQPANPGLHSAEQIFGGGGGDSGPLKVTYLLPPPQDLATHVFDLRPDKVQVDRSTSKTEEQIQNMHSSVQL